MIATKRWPRASPPPSARSSPEQLPLAVAPSKSQEMAQPGTPGEGGLRAGGLPERPFGHGPPQSAPRCKHTVTTLPPQQTSKGAHFPKVVFRKESAGECLDWGTPGALQDLREGSRPEERAESKSTDWVLRPSPRLHHPHPHPRLLDWQPKKTDSPGCPIPTHNPRDIELSSL